MKQSTKALLVLKVLIFGVCQSLNVTTYLGCNDDYMLENGHADFPANETGFNQSLPVVCDSGYEVKGDSKITCLGNGTWSSNTACVETGGVNVNAIIVAAVVFVVATISCVVVLLIFTRSPKVSLTDDIEGPDMHGLDMEVKVWGRFRPEFITLDDFPAYVKALHEGKNRLFADGFRLLNDQSPTHSTTDAENPACQPKIRFSNILPFDHSRVKLLPREGEEGSDFINANYVPGYTTPQEYIAAQGPVAETKNDFWRMIWEQDVEIVVMLTQRIESGKGGSLPRNASLERHWLVQTYETYWPDEVQGPVYYGDIIVKMQSESVMTDYVLRKLEIQLGESSKYVTHFHFVGWPDTGRPRKTWPFINFVTMVRKHHIYTHGKHTVVHCSTGVGRTGMFIAVDRLLQYIGEHNEVDVYSVLLDMRNYRFDLVKTEEQFIYIYECIRHFITMEDDSLYGDDVDECQYTGTKYGQATFENTAFQKD